MELPDICRFLAAGIARADAAGPVAVNARTGSPYQAGIGPHTEAQTTRLALSALTPVERFHHELEVPYPGASRSKCDICIGKPSEWALEVKMLRLMGDNAKPNDNILMHILSPYPAHRSALTDCDKLLASGFAGRKAIVIFGYDYDDWPMDPAIEAFELLATRRARIGDRTVAGFDGLIHPVHRRGRVFAWELLALS